MDNWKDQWFYMEDFDKWKLAERLEYEKHTLRDVVVVLSGTIVLILLEIWFKG